MTQIDTPVGPPVSTPPPPTPPAKPAARRRRLWVVALAAAVSVAVVALLVAGLGGSKSASAGAKVDIALREFKVAMPSTVHSGTKTLEIKNDGKMEHELLIFHPDASIDPAHLPLGADGDVNEDAPGVNKVSDGDNIGVGKSQTRKVDLSQPGTYVFLCNLPGHYKMGMWTEVTVK